jgi:hypothetical protein
VHPSGLLIDYALKGGRNVGVATVKDIASAIQELGE